MVLYMLYYPPHLKYLELSIDTHDSRPPRLVKTPTKSSEWRLSILLSWVVAAHLYVPAPFSFALINLFLQVHNHIHDILPHCYTTTYWKMGYISWSLICYACGYSICAPDCPHIQRQGCWCAEYTDDAHPESWGCFDGLEYCAAPWNELDQ